MDRLGKKGFLAGALVDVYAIIFFLLVIILFYVIFSVTTGVRQAELSGVSDVFSGNLYASSYLRMPVEVNGAEMEMSSLIALANIDNQYHDKFMEETQRFVDLFLDKNDCYYFRIKGKLVDEYFAESGCANLRSDAEMRDWVNRIDMPIDMFVSHIPSLDGNTIDIYLFNDLEALESAYKTRKYKRPNEVP